MSRAARYLLPALIAGHIAWRILAPTESVVRDLYLYNFIWLIALVVVVYAPLSLDRVALGAIVLAIFFWGIGSFATSFDELFSPSPRFTVATQVLYILFYPLILIAIPRLSTLTGKLRPIELLDSLIFGLGFTSITATLLLVTIFPAETLTGTADFFTIFYPVGDLALLLISVTTLITRGVDKQSLLFASGVLVFAVTIAPAARRRAIRLLSWSGTLLRNPMLPYVVSKSLVACKSFTPNGSPCKGPKASPRMTADSACFALARARSKSVAQIALIAGLSASIRAMQASMSSTGDTWRAPIRRRSSTAESSGRLIRFDV